MLEKPKSNSHEADGVFAARLRERKCPQSQSGASRPQCLQRPWEPEAWGPEGPCRASPRAAQWPWQSGCLSKLCWGTATCPQCRRLTPPWDPAIISSKRPHIRGTSCREGHMSAPGQLPVPSCLGSVHQTGVPCSFQSSGSLGWA